MNLQTMFLKEKSFENYDDSAVLECLLSTAGVRTDIPVLIDNMFSTFGSFKGILEARPAQLMKIEGMTKKTASLIAMIAPLAKVWERCCMTNAQYIRSRFDAEAYCKSLVMAEQTERFYVICINAQCKLLGHKKISEGTLSEVSCYPRRVIETALDYNAHAVFLCHNHPGGTNQPSPEDIASTKQLQRVLKSIGILLVDHIIVSNNETYSMIQHNDIDIRG